MRTLAKTGAALFVAWGVIHVLGGLSIMAATSGDAAAGYATYRGAGDSYDALAGAVLGYFAWLLVVAGVAVALIGATLNWKNSERGLAVNTVLVGVIEIGLVWFLVLPGYVAWAEAAIGIVPFVLATVLSGMACRSAHAEGPATA